MHVYHAQDAGLSTHNCVLLVVKLIMTLAAEGAVPHQQGQVIRRMRIMA